MKSLAVLVAALAALLVPPAGSARASEPAVEPWIRFELAAIASNGLNPPRASRALALVSRAMFEAAEAGGRDRDAAVAGAAATMLAHLFPGEAEQARALAEPARSASKRGGFAEGVAVALRLVARAESDGSSAVWTGTPPTGAGIWAPTPPGFVFPPLEPLAGTVTPPGHWNAIALELLDGVGFGTLRTARLFAVLNTAQADAFIACWDAKFTYWSLRPVTAIRTLVDASWSPLIATPPFPSYVSGHSTTSGAASTVLGRFFPSRARKLTRLAEEATSSRLYGGIHFSSDNETGLQLGRRIGAVALEAYTTDDD